MLTVAYESRFDASEIKTLYPEISVVSISSTSDQVLSSFAFAIYVEDSPKKMPEHSELVAITSPDGVSLAVKDRDGDIVFQSQSKRGFLITNHGEGMFFIKKARGQGFDLQIHRSGMLLTNRNIGFWGRIEFSPLG